MITAERYFYKGKVFDTLEHVAEVTRGIPSLNKVIVVSYTRQKPDLSMIPNAVHYGDFLSREDHLEIGFAQLPFGHPIYVMFSSGTTGKPKCMVQGVGVLINHLKELVLHSDLKRSDRIFYITSCSWMMWNWQLSSLAAGATVVLYDGNPNHPDPGAMWKLIQDEQITIVRPSSTSFRAKKEK